MDAIAKLRSQFPQYENVSDGDLLLAVHRKHYSQMHVKDFLAKTDPDGSAKKSISDKMWNGYYADAVSKPYGDETPEQAKERAYGKMSPLQEDPGYVEGAGRAAFQGATLGAGDEIVAAGAAALDPIFKGSGGTFGERYQKYKGEESGRVDRFRETNPVTATVAEIGGSIPTMIAGGTALNGTKGLVGAMRGGATAGGIYGFNADEGNVADRVDGTLKGVALGAATGAALHGAGKAVQAVRNPNKGTKAGKMLTKALSRDEIPLDEVGKRLDDLGPNAMVADLGPNLGQQAEGIASLPGKGQTILRQAIKDRSAPEAVTERITQDLTKNLGRSSPAYAVAEELAAKQAQAAKPLYDAVRNVPVKLDGSLLFVTKTPMGQKAFNKAMQAAANDGVPTNQGMTAGIVDYAKRSLDDIANAAARAGNNNEARQARKLAGMLTKEMDKRVPAYKTARESFASFEQVKEALDDGVNLFKNKMHPDEMRKKLAKMGPGEKEAFVQGVQSSVADIMGTARNDALQIRNLLDKGYNRERLALAIGKDQADDLIRAIDREFIFKGTANRVTGGSATAGRQAAQAEVDPAARNINRTSVVDVVIAAFNKAKNAIGSKSVAKRNEELAKILAGNKVDPKLLKSSQPLPQIDANLPAALGGGQAGSLSGNFSQ